MVTTIQEGTAQTPHHRKVNHVGPVFGKCDGLGIQGNRFHAQDHIIRGTHLVHDGLPGDGILKVRGPMGVDRLLLQHFFHIGVRTAIVELQIIRKLYGVVLQSFATEEVHTVPLGQNISIHEHFASALRRQEERFNQVRRAEGVERVVIDTILGRYVAHPNHEVGIVFILSALLFFVCRKVWRLTGQAEESDFALTFILERHEVHRSFLRR